MAFPLKKSHKIHVDGHDLVWCYGRLSMRSLRIQVERFDFKLRVASGMGPRVVLQSAAGEGAKLIVSLPFDWFDDPPVTPSVVAKWARQGLRQGWRPGVRGTDVSLEGNTYPG